MGQDPEALGLQVGSTAGPFRHVLRFSWPDHRLVDWRRTVHHRVLDWKSTTVGGTTALEEAEEVEVGNWRRRWERRKRWRRKRWCVEKEVLEKEEGEELTLRKKIKIKRVSENQIQRKLRSERFTCQDTKQNPQNLKPLVKIRLMEGKKENDNNNKTLSHVD